MIASRQIPTEFERWNARWGAPYGRRRMVDPLLPGNRLRQWFRGPFAFQSNNGTRRFEYPWAYREVRRRGRGLDVIEIGGGLSGLQFVLAREGDRVVNVDPGEPGRQWSASQRRHAALCRRFRAPVRLVNATIGAAGLPDACADVIVCLSVLEHLSDAQLDEVAAELRRLLRPDGIVVLTVDLFLDAAPFCSAERNRWGRNIDVRAFLERAGLELRQGRTDQLLGFDDFRTDAVLRDLGAFMLADYPCLAQCLVAQRPDGGGSHRHSNVPDGSDHDERRI